MEDQSGSMTPGDRELERRLEAYADARLSPSNASTTETRRAVMAAAHRQAAVMAADATAAAGETSAPRADAPKRTFWQTWRRPMAAVFAGFLMLGVLAGSAWAARPGGPLYPARLWAEMDNLPKDLLARAQAEVRRLQARLDEAQQASSAGDPAGTEAALVAYATIVVEATRGSQGDASARSTIEGAVEAQVTVLTALVTSAPPPARAAAQNALTQSTLMLRDLKGPGGAVDDPGSSDGTDRGGGAGHGPKADRPGTAETPGDAVSCARAAEPSQDAVATTDGADAACAPAASAPGTPNQGANAKSPAPTDRPADKNVPPGRQAPAPSAGPGDHAKQSPAPHVTGNGSGQVTGSGSGQEKPASSSPAGQAPDPTPSPPSKSASDAHKP